LPDKEHQRKEVFLVFRSDFPVWVLTGGGIEEGETPQEAAIREAKEETGLDIKKEELVLVAKVREKGVDQVTNLINEKFQARYIYQYSGHLFDLKVTEGERFEAWPVDELLNISDKDKNKFIYSIFTESNLWVFIKIKELIS